MTTGASIPYLPLHIPLHSSFLLSISPSIQAHCSHLLYHLSCLWQVVWPAGTGGCSLHLMQPYHYLWIYISQQLAPLLCFGKRGQWIPPLLPIGARTGTLPVCGCFRPDAALYKPVRIGLHNSFRLLFHFMWVENNSSRTSPGWRGTCTAAEVISHAWCNLLQDSTQYHTEHKTWPLNFLASGYGNHAHSLGILSMVSLYGLSCLSPALCTLSAWWHWIMPSKLVYTACVMTTAVMPLQMYGYYEAWWVV